MSCVVTESIGVYMLGAVDERERAAMDAHLEGCAACRAVADELRPVPVLLGRVHVDDLTPPEPSGHLLDRLLDARMVSRRRRRLGFMLAAAVLVTAAVVTAGAIGGGAAAEDAQNITVGTTSVTATQADTGVIATAWLTAHPWGTEIRLRLAGVTPGEWCSLLVTDREGGTETAASWIVRYGGDVDVPGATETTLDGIEELAVVTGDGVRLASIPVNAM